MPTPTRDPKPPRVTPKTRQLAARIRKGSPAPPRTRRLDHTDDQRHNSGRDDG